VEWIDIYHLSRSQTHPNPAPKFAELEDEMVPEIPHDTEILPQGTGPFPGLHTRRNANMMFNLTEYSRLLMADFMETGGRIETREFHTPADLALLPQRTLINCTGYGAKALFGDQSVTPVRGQLARLIPQPEVQYGLTYEDVGLVPRRDGLVVQYYGSDEGLGFGDDSTAPDLADAKHAVETIGSLFRGAPETS
jgi:hypothetical protein